MQEKKSRVADEKAIASKADALFSDMITEFPSTEFNAIEEKAEAITKDKVLQQREQWAKKRSAIAAKKKKLGLAPSRQARSKKFKSHGFMSESVTDKAIHFIINTARSTAYNDGCDICPRTMLGIPAFNKMSTKNAFEHLKMAQGKLLNAREVGNQPDWVILSNDTSQISDRILMSRLVDLRATTHIAGAFGMERIPANGKWWQISPADESQLRGCYIQAKADSMEWDFVVGPRFKDAPKFRVLIIHGPFIAVRGETFVKLDFDYMAKNCKKGFHHWMADISMQVAMMGHMAATVKTHAIQYHNILDVKDSEDFIHDQAAFNSHWQDHIPKNYRDSVS